MNFEVDFTGGDFGEHHKAGIRDTLRRIGWAHSVHGVEVVRRLTGGVGGALVLQIRLAVGSTSRLKVVKIAPAEETDREWQAYRDWIEQFANAWCTPLPARTPDRASDDPARAWTAVAYDHVGQFAGNPEETVRTLEELGGRGLDELAAAVAEILTSTREVLHGRCEVEPHKLSLRGLNPELGPNLVLEVERLSGDGLPQRSTSDYKLLHRDDVLRRTASGGRDDIEDGTRVTIGDLRVERRDGVVLAVDDEIVVELRSTPDAGPGLGELVDGARVSVWGRVVGTRGRASRDRVAVAMGRTAEEHAFADPFAVLPTILCEQLVGRVHAVSHGDLNLRNVLCVGNGLFLIDYARAGMRPQQTDFCWLELGIVRDLLAGRDFGDLLRLHRCVALATALLEFGCVADVVSGLMAPLAGGAMRDAFELLFVLRRQAWICYPDNAGPRLSEEYLRHLLLAAHRAMKWPEERRTPEKVRATVAEAAVAAEWLNGENPCQYWDQALLSAALVALAPVIPLGDDNAVRLVGDLVTAVAAFGTPADEIEHAVATLAARLVECRCGVAARTLLTARPDDGFVELSIRSHRPEVVKTLANTGAVTLLGPSGSGKSTVVRELARRLATDIVAGRQARMPVLVEDVGLLPSFPDLLRGTGLAEVAAEALTLGAVHVLVDADPTGADPRVDAFVATVRARFPRTRMVVCQREAGAVSAQVAELQPLSYDDMVAWFRRGLTDRMDAEHLAKVLTDDPRWAWVELDRPRWLSLVAGYVCEHGLPDPLPAPHEVIALMPERVDVSRDAQLHQSHLRAHELAEADADAVVDGVRRIGEWDAYRILVTLPGTDPGLVRRLAAALEDARPEMAAELLRAAGLDGAEFAERMMTVLRDPRAGPLRWRASAGALRVLAEPHGADGLARVAVDGTAPDEAAREALASLGELYDMTLPRPLLRDVASRLAAVVRQVLDTSELAARREAALATASGIPGLELHIVPLIDEATPWPVLDGACQALHARGVTMPPRLVAIRTTASNARLAVLDATLPSLTTRVEIDAAHAERSRLIAELAQTATLPWLLLRRFAFDAHRQVAAMVDQHLDDEPDDDTAQDEELGFRLQAHRLLSEVPGTAGTVLTWLPAGASATRLLVAAAAVPYADQSRLGHLADRFVALLDTVEVDRLEGMAALILAIGRQDRWLGMRLARTATATLVRRDLRERHHWPWADAIARIHTAAARDLDAMVRAGGDAADAAVTALTSHDFHRSGRPGPVHNLSGLARQRLLDLPRTADWALTAAAATLVEALPELPKLAAAPDTVVRRRSARYGVVEQAEAADVLAVIGYLARTAHDQGRMASDVAAARRFLTEFDSADRHPSVATGRLIGLAYLGDWQPVLRADLSDLRLRDAARHAIERWRSGPATPAGGEYAVAQWISERLRGELVPIAHRWVLEDLRERAERIAGVLVER